MDLLDKNVGGKRLCLANDAKKFRQEKKKQNAKIS